MTVLSPFLSHWYTGKDSWITPFSHTQSVCDNCVCVCVLYFSSIKCHEVLCGKLKVIADRLSQSVAPARSNHVWDGNNKLRVSQIFLFCVHMETRFCEYAHIFYQIFIRLSGILEEWNQFLKPGARMDKFVNTAFVFSSWMANLYFLKRWRHQALAPNQTPVRHITATETWTNTEWLSFY